MYNQIQFEQKYLEFRTRCVVFKEEFIIVVQTQGINNHEYFKLIVLEPTTSTATGSALQYQ